MLRPRNHIPLLLLLALAPSRSWAQSPLPGLAPPQPMAVISRNAPVYASTSVFGHPPSKANGDVYDALGASGWVAASVPAWIAYDLSGAPASRRAKVDVLWISDLNGYECDIASGGSPVGLPCDYTIEVNAASSATPPADGWVSLVSVSGNVFKSRQHVIDLSGYTWVRMNVTRVLGGSTLRLLHLDVHDLSQTSSGQPEDSWIYFGDSITFGGLNYFGHYPYSPNDFSFATLVHAQMPSRFPAQEDGGLMGTTVVDAVDHIGDWLANFPGRYVGVCYGTNDAGRTPPDRFYACYATIVQQVLDAGKVPVVPTIPWGKSARVQDYAPELNLEILQLYDAFPGVVHGPDLWTLFRQNPSFIRDGDVHPTERGYGQMKQWWVQTMLWNVYGIEDVSVGRVEPGASSLAIAARGRNPSRGDVWIDFQLPLQAPASLELLDVQGRRILAREVGSLGPGRHTLELEPSRLGSGLYLVRLRQGAETRTARVTILR